MKKTKQIGEVDKTLEKFIKLHEKISIECWVKSDKIPNAKQFDFKSAWNMFTDLLINLVEKYETK